jgi:hypothetical protein
MQRHEYKETLPRAIAIENYGQQNLSVFDKVEATEISELTAPFTTPYQSIKLVPGVVR